MDLLRLTLEKQGEEGIMKRQSIRWVLRKKGDQIFKRDPEEFFLKVHFKLIYIFLHVVNLKS